MKVLVVGAGGNLGWPLCKQLVDQGANVFALTRPGREHPAGTIHVPMELRELNPENLPVVDAIIYLAQSKSFRDFPEQWEDIFDINVRVPLRLADWARRLGVKGFHYASSGGVYESGVIAVRENAEINANRDSDFYVGSRLSAEVLLRNFASFFESFSLIRPFFIYGPRQSRTMLLPRLVDNVKFGRDISLVGEEGLKINPIHADDAAIAVAKLVHLKGFHALNIAGPEVLSLKQIAEIVGASLGVKPVLSYKPGIATELVGDISKMCELLVPPKTTFAEGLRDLIS